MFVLVIKSNFRNNEIRLCLEIYKCIVMYNFVPSEAILHFVSCLCSVVNLPEVRAHNMYIFILKS